SAARARMSDIRRHETVISVHLRDRRTRLLASSVLTGGTLRDLAVAAGMMTALGISPALAQCFSGAGSNLGAAGCQVTSVGGANVTAVGKGITAIGNSATA